MDMIRIGLIGIVGVLFAVAIKSYKAEYGIYITVADIDRDGTNPGISE